MFTPKHFPNLIFLKVSIIKVTQNYTHRSHTYVFVPLNMQKSIVVVYDTWAGSVVVDEFDACVGSVVVEFDACPDYVVVVVVVVDNDDELDACASS